MSTQVDMKRMEILVLARLSTSAKKPLIPSVVTRSLRPYLEQHLSRHELRAVVAAAILELEDSGDISTSPRRLADQGRQRLREFFGLTKDLPWSILKKHYLTAKVLSLAPTENTRKRIASPGGLRATVLWRHHQLPHSGPPTLNQAVDALVWRELGVDTDAPLTLDRIRAHFLQKVAGTPRAQSRDKLEKLLAARAASSQRTEPDSLRLGLVQRWLFARPEPRPAAEAPIAEPAPEPSLPGPEAATDPSTGPGAAFLQAFAHQVNRVAASVPEGAPGRFGDRKVFISAIWQRMREHPMCASMTVDTFKELLVLSNRADLVWLHRADLIPAMPMDEVSASEIKHSKATFHFVEIRPQERHA